MPVQGDGGPPLPGGVVQLRKPPLHPVQMPMGRHDPQPVHREERLLGSGLDGVVVTPHRDILHPRVPGQQHGPDGLGVPHAVPQKHEGVNGAPVHSQGRRVAKGAHRPMRIGNRHQALAHGQYTSRKTFFISWAALALWLTLFFSASLI